MNYRARPYDLMNDIWILQKRFLWLFWIPMGTGTKERVQQQSDELNGAIYLVGFGAMKPAHEWQALRGTVGSFGTPSELAWIEQIQLDAFKAGMNQKKL